jgi:hypothetical protein
VGQLQIAVMLLRLYERQWTVIGLRSFSEAQPLIAAWFRSEPPGRFPRTSQCGCWQKARRRAEFMAMVFRHAECGLEKEDEYCVRSR